MGKLTALQVKSAKPRERQIKLTDGAGLYLLIMPNGSKYWRYDYRYLDKRKTLPLGVYPDITLSDARDLHAEVRQKIKGGIDPAHDLAFPIDAHGFGIYHGCDALGAGKEGRIADHAGRRAQKLFTLLEHA